MAFRIVQPWGPEKARQASLISEHPTAVEASPNSTGWASQMVRTAGPSDAIS